MKLDVAHVSLPMVGEIANGDRAVSCTDGEGRFLFGVIDGLGHGVDAAAASQAAIECLQTVALDTSLHGIMQQVHDRLIGSRGAAGTVCVVRDGAIEVCAVGNVEVRSDMRIPLVFSPGILGVRVAKLHACRAAIPSRARIVLFSDGISSRVPVDDVRSLAPSLACDALMQKYRRKEDDATVLVADAE